ncbi:hypothetical protein SB48_HM08orf00312 [Heyndrickxia coagulans]|uniref:Uncharacterized protein n=1 Tax=Heyndrickxia coagulans TaxID=1398 RepID=A0AAN0W9X0_HEYCO|nr:hypothetical protein SB48_HM08orf00312 [Heyndrickxia coagulans]
MIALIKNTDLNKRIHEKQAMRLPVFFMGFRFARTDFSDPKTIFVEIRSGNDGTAIFQIRRNEQRQID